MTPEILFVYQAHLSIPSNINITHIRTNTRLKIIILESRHVTVYNTFLLALNASLQVK
jgi:hypothetical protein